MIELDAIDRKILRALAEDATLGAGALGRRFDMSQPAMWRRVKRLQDAGAFRARRLVLDNRGDRWQGAFAWARRPGCAGWWRSFCWSLP